MFDPVSPPAESIRDLTVLVFAITGFIFVVVEGILVYCIFRFRHAGATGSRPTAAEPPQVYGSKPIEIAWTAAPALIVFVLMLVTARTLWEVNVDAPEPKADDHALFVTVIGRQWWWEYRYDTLRRRATRLHHGQRIARAGRAIRRERARPVYLTLQSADVCHSFWVPRLAGKTDLIPGRTNHMWFETAKPGLFLGQCAEYCGTQHANMLLRVIVDSPAKISSLAGRTSESSAADDAAAAKPARRRSWRSRASIAIASAAPRPQGPMRRT